MTSPRRDPLTGTARLLIDGSNLLHAMRRRPGGAPAPALIGRLRAAIPPTTGIELVLDGPPEPGMRGERVAAGVRVRHTGRRPADDVLLDLVDEVRAGGGPADTAALLVVTDDAALRSAIQGRGARVAGSSWLIGRLDRPRLAAPSVGNRSAPPPPMDGQGDDGATRWSPGRGATVKRGNPRRGRASSGRMPR